MKKFMKKMVIALALCGASVPATWAGWKGNTLMVSSALCFVLTTCNPLYWGLYCMSGDSGKPFLPDPVTLGAASIASFCGGMAINSHEQQSSRIEELEKKLANK